MSTIISAGLDSAPTQYVGGVGTVLASPVALAAPDNNLPSIANQASFLDDFADTNWTNWYNQTTSGTVAAPALVTGTTINKIAFSTGGKQFNQSQFGPTQVVKGTVTRLSARLRHDVSAQSFVVGLFRNTVTDPFGSTPTDGVWVECIAGTWNCKLACSSALQTATSGSGLFRTGAVTGLNDIEILLEGGLVDSNQCQASFFINGAPVAVLSATTSPQGHLQAAFGGYAPTGAFNLYIDRLGRRIQGLNASDY